MAKFLYRMQNILDIKYKLEEAAKQEYREARGKFDEAEEDLKKQLARRNEYLQEYQNAITGKLDLLQIDECSNSIEVIDEIILEKRENVKNCSRELEKARVKLSEVMQERKMHEKLKEKKFDEFINDLNSQVNKETDEIVSYQFNTSENEMEE